MVATAYLVGAGPGDPGLMTARSLELIADADAILYDRLIPEGALAGAREDAELIYVGKAPGAVAMEQREIERRMVELARAGKSVVRLKGGDPFVFGRGGEEAEALTDAGVPFEVVPGITAGVAAPAYAGIPVTNRGDAAAVAFVTGHRMEGHGAPTPAGAGEGEAPEDWEALARFPGTLVVYMGVRNLGEIAERLIAGGRGADEPAAIVAAGTGPRQRTVVATTATLAEAAEREGIVAPAVSIFGPVAAMRERIAWFEQRPLHGVSVVVTRARAQTSDFAAMLRALGAGVVELPAIRVEARLGTPAVEAMLDQLHAYSLVCLASPNGVRHLFEAMDGRGMDARALASATVAVVGPSTARALRRFGVIADVVPQRAVSESLVEALEAVDVADRPVLVAGAAGARDVLPKALAEREAKVDVVSLYETVAESLDADAAEAIANADYVSFTSTSTVRYLLEALGGRLPEGPRVATIGPVTTATARELGLRVHVEAERHDLEGLTEALVADASEQQKTA